MRACEPLPLCVDPLLELGRAAQVDAVAKAYRILADEGVVALDHGKIGHVIAPRAARRPIDAALQNELAGLLGRMCLRGASEEEIREVFERTLARFTQKGT